MAKFAALPPFQGEGKVNNVFFMYFVFSYSKVCVSNFMFMISNYLWIRQMGSAILLQAGISNIGRPTFTPLTQEHGIQERGKKG